MAPHFFNHISMDVLNKQQIVDIFNDFFGEENVDNTNIDNDTCQITIHFPEVRISNEHDESHLIKDLWIRQRITSNGCLLDKFTVHRSYTSYKEYVYNYAHSHVPHRSGVNEWQNPCTGDGPINGTIANLMAHGGDEDDWMIYCRELQQWTQVESEVGVPYRHLNEISRHTGTTSTLCKPLTYCTYLQYQLDPSTQTDIIVDKCIEAGLGELVMQDNTIKFKMDDFNLALRINYIAKQVIPPDEYPRFYTTMYISNNLLHSNTNNCIDIDQMYVDGITDFIFKGQEVIYKIEQAPIIEDFEGIKYFNKIGIVYQAFKAKVFKKFIDYIKTYEQV